MMGGAMAKSALSNLGVQLDHLVLGVGNSIEVGKKLTDEITIIYVNDEISSVKLKYEHGKRTESIFGASEESFSYDIIYKRDF
jgi:translocation and assembly module TamB